MGWLRQLNEDYWQADQVERLDAKLQPQQQAAEPAFDEFEIEPDPAAERVKALELDLGRMTLIVQSLIETCVRKGLLSHHEISGIIEDVNLESSSSQWGVAAENRPVITPPRPNGHAPVVPNHIHDWAEFAGGNEGLVAPAIGVGGNEFAQAGTSVGSPASLDDFEADEADSEEPTDVEGGLPPAAFSDADGDFLGAEPAAEPSDGGFEFGADISDPTHFGDVAHHEAGEPAAAVATAPIRTSGAPKRRKKSGGAIRQLVGVFGGGAIGLAIGYMILLWVGGPEKDFLEFSKKMPKWMLPASFQSNGPSSASVADMKNPLKPDPNAGKFNFDSQLPPDSKQPAQKPATKPAGDDPFNDQPAAEETASDLPGVDDPLANPEGESPAGDSLASADDGDEKMPLEDPLASDGSEEPMDEEAKLPGSEEEPATEEPGSEETPGSEEIPSSVPDDKQPRTAESEDPASEDPASEDPASEDPATEDPAEAPTTTAEDPAAEPEKKPESVASVDPVVESDPAAETDPPATVDASPVRGAAAVSSAAFEEALAAANLGVDSLKQGSLADAALKKGKVAAYTKFCELANAINLVVAGDPADLAPQQEAALKIAAESVQPPTSFADVQTIARGWLKRAKRETAGVLLAGKVTEVRPSGDQTAVVLDLGSNVTVTVLTAVEPQLAEGDAAVVLGLIVDEPAANLAGYSGEEKQAVWSSHLAKVEPAAE